MLPLESQRHCSRGAVKELWTTVGVTKGAKEGERDAESQTFRARFSISNQKSQGITEKLECPEKMPGLSRMMALT